MWFFFQLLMGLMALGVSTYHAFVMRERAIEATTLGHEGLSTLAYGMVGFHLLTATICLSALYFVIKRQYALRRSQG